MTMGDDRSDDHLKIFKCLVDTGADVLRSTLERKVLNNNAITFEQYLDNVKHQFYHQFEKNRSKPCCSQSPHVNCNVHGYMDKKIFEKVYNKTSELDTRQCLDRFEVKAGVSIDGLDLSDLNFFLWNSNMLSAQETQSLQTIMTIRSNICHPESTHCYSITELESVWISLEKDILLFAEPYRYKKMVTLQITTLKKNKINELDSECIINEMATESEKIILEMKLEVQTRNDCTNQLMKEESLGIKSCIKDACDKTTSFINEKAQKLAENHKVLTTICIEEIKTTVKEDSSNTRLHNEDQRRAIDSHLTESENRVCQTVVQSGGRLEDKLTEQENEIRKHNVKLNEDVLDLMERNRKLTAMFMEMKTDINELKTILIGYVGKQKVQLVMNTEQIEKSTELPEYGKVDMTAKISQTHVTEDKENEIIKNLPPEVKIQTNNDSFSEAAVTETIEITGKKVNSIILDLKATPGILHSEETFKAGILTLVQVMQKAGGIDADIEDTVTVNLKFESPLTEDQFAVVKCLFAKEWNADNDTTQLPVFHLETTKPIAKTFCQLCDNKDRRIRALEEQNEKHEIVIKRNILDLQAEKRKLEDLQAEKRKLEDLQPFKRKQEDLQPFKRNQEDLQAEKRKLEDLQAFKRKLEDLQPFKRNQEGLLIDTQPDGTDMISVSEKLGTIQKEVRSSYMSSLGFEHTYDSRSQKTLYKCRHCYEMEVIIIQLDRRLCEIRRRIIEAKGQPFFMFYRRVNETFEDLLKITDQNTSITSIEEKGRMKDKELKCDRGSQTEDSKLISDVDVHDSEKKANKKLMESQSSQGRRPELDQTEEKGDVSLRISEIRHEYASRYYTKTDKQKGLGIIVRGKRSTHSPRVRDYFTTHVQGFFEEIGFVVKHTESDQSKLLKYITDGQFYCVFIVLSGRSGRSGLKGYDEYPLQHLLSQKIGKPVIIMTDGGFDFTHFKESFEDNEILIVMPIRQRSTGSYRYPDNIIGEFMRVTRINRFADIIDILIRINSRHQYPVITFRSTLRKNFSFL